MLDPFQVSTSKKKTVRVWCELKWCVIDNALMNHEYIYFWCKRDEYDCSLGGRYIWEWDGRVLQIKGSA